MHSAPPRRAARLAAVASLAALVLVCIAAAGPASLGAVAHPATQSALLAQEVRDVAAAKAQLSAPLPLRRGQAVPTPPTVIFKAPLRPHEVLGFIGASGFAGVTAAELSATSALVTGAVGMTPSGSLDQASPGWGSLSNPGFASFVSTAHAQGDRVLLGVSGGSAAVIARLLRTAGASAGQLSSAVSAALTADHLDGVDLDIEGHNPANRAQFVRFVAAFARGVRASDPSAQIALNVYPQSAAGSGFFNIRALAGQVSALFVMAYDMVDPGHASPNAPLLTPGLGLSDVQSAIQYSAIVPPSKLILGIPFYGYDFPAASGTPGAATTGAPESVTYGAPGGIVAVGHQGLWDPTSLTPYYSFRRGKQWHQTWYDDPDSVALKVALASDLGLAGVGAWELGYEGTQTAMLRALDGDSSPSR